ncbi:MAG: asparagine synthase (glutamine-hydrolyzing) [Arcticibacterium sp.]|jgi:asparagine synthase (glutamine-hydrolysing)
MGKFLHIQQFNKALDYLDMQPVLRPLNYTLLGNGQSFQQFGQQAKKLDEAKESWLLDIYPENAFKPFDNLSELDAEFSGLYFHKMKFSIDLFRDVFGVKSLFYYFKDGLLIASNELRAVISCLPSVPAADEDEIADYFNPAMADDFVNDNTFFKDIKRVLPGELLHFRAGIMERSFYWEANLKTKGNTQTLIRDFKTQFEAVILKKTEQQSNIAAKLSGSLDSSSICSVISHQSNKNLKGIFYDSKNEDSLEKAYVQEVAIKGAFELDTVLKSEGIYTSTKKITALTCKPESMVIPSATFLPVMNSAAQHQSEILVSDHGGESTVGYGYEFIRDLIAKNQLRKAKEALKSKWYFEEAQIPFEEYFIQELLSHSGIPEGRLFIQIALSGTVPLKILWDLLRKRAQRKIIASSDASILLKKQVLTKRRNHLKNWYQSHANRHEFLYLKNSLLAPGCHTMETLDAMGRQYKLISTYPFLDKKLLAISASVSSETNYAGGYLRGTLREAMHGTVPESVRLRTQKFAFSDAAYKMFLELEIGCEDLFPEQHRLWTYVNKNIYDEHLSKINDQKLDLKSKDKYIWVCSKVLYLGIWLDEFYPAS